jgi:hypothetical protein
MIRRERRQWKVKAGNYEGRILSQQLEQERYLICLHCVWERESDSMMHAIGRYNSKIRKKEKKKKKYWESSEMSFRARSSKLCAAAQTSMASLRANRAASAGPPQEFSEEEDFNTVLLYSVPRLIQHFLSSLPPLLLLKVTSSPPLLVSQHGPLTTFVSPAAAVSVLTLAISPLPSKEFAKSRRLWRKLEQCHAHDIVIITAQK